MFSTKCKRLIDLTDHPTVTIKSNFQNVYTKKTLVYRQLGVYTKK